jgi:hypothetical protein
MFKDKQIKQVKDKQVEQLESELEELRGIVDFILLPLTTSLFDKIYFNSSSILTPNINPLRKFISFRLRNEALSQKAKDFLTRVLERNFIPHNPYNPMR